MVVGGQSGVEQVLQHTLAGLNTTFGLAGYKNLCEVQGPCYTPGVCLRAFVGIGTTRKKEGRNVEPNANGRVDSWKRVARIFGISESSSAFSHHSAPLVIRVQNLERQAKLEILQLLGTFGPLAVPTRIYGLELGTDNAAGQVSVKEADAAWNVVCCRTNETKVRFAYASSCIILKVLKWAVQMA